MKGPGEKQYRGGKALKMVIYIFVGLAAASVIFILISKASFSSMVSRSVSGLAADAGADGPAGKFTYSLEGLPGPVQRYFRHVLPEGQEYIRFVRLKQKAEIKTSEGGKWMPLEAEQYFTVEKPGFVWHAMVRPAPLLWIEGRDMYYHGRGSMFIKLLSAVGLVDARGSELDQGALLRYLSEMPWFPTSLLSGAGNIKWEPMDDEKARATIKDGDLTVSAVFYFNGAGEITRMETMDRYNSEEKKKMKYTTHYSNYQIMGGVKIPTEGVVEWNYPDRDFQYFRLQGITDLQYNLVKEY